MLEIIKFILGPAYTNCYLIGDTESNQAVAIDPGWDGHKILSSSNRRGWHIREIWYTHAHFDHIGGAGAVSSGNNPAPLAAIHPKDMDLWKAQGGAPLFGFQIDDPGPEPTIMLEHGMQLELGEYTFEVRFAPGHSPGHVMFYCPAEKLVFCGDVIFDRSIGRTDLPGGNYDTLMESIRTQVLTLPDETRLLTGHGPETTVGREKENNPFLSEKGYI